MTIAVDPVLLAAKALDGMQLRAAALAHNLANTGAPQFRVQEVSFEADLRRAAMAGPEALHSLRFSIRAGPLRGPDDERRDDLLLVDAAANAMRFAAVADLASRRLALAAAIAGAR